MRAALPEAGGKETSSTQLRRNAPLWLSVAALAVALLGFLLSVPRIGSLQSEATRRLQTIDDRLAELQSADQPMRAELRDLRDRLAVLERRGFDIASLQAQVENLYRNLAEDSTDVLLAEVESSLVLAGQQLALGVGAQSALAAMQELDARLARQDDPGLQPLRASLLHDIERVKAYPAADVGSLALRLDALMRSIDGFPLLSSVTSRRRDANAQPGGLGALRDELEQLFRVRRVDAPDAMLLAPEQSYFLRENLRLLLLNARLSLLSRNEKLFRDDVGRAIDWLRTYYDDDDRAVAGAVAQLRQLSGTRIVLEPPTLAESLSAVRAARAARATRDATR
ncbi:MAG: uroporphyrinogen-III C-methyltransferase [Burkholderiaceae bacterium]|nr:uroporphyrinogen-III C-methyltransferase [Burkholderiaceae bacterium]MCD6673680.1 uroporphyrinogen-III C-methyltransferase [Burkholderiaceae bacterium]